MIRQLGLKNWRSYESVTIDFDAGTTFVVASNGVGKTSLVEAARWAIFGIVESGQSAVRAGSDSAVASVQLVLPDLRVLFVERTLRRTSRRESPVVRLDGAPISEPEMFSRLIESYGTEPAFLARITMPPMGREDNAPTNFGLEAHLGRYYGIDGLQAAIEQLTARRKATDAQIRRIKVVYSTTAQRLDEMRAEVERTKDLIEQATVAQRTAQIRADLMRAHESRRAQLASWQAAQAAWMEATQRLATQVAGELGRIVPPDELEAALEEQRTELDRQIEATRVEMAVRRTRESTLASNDEGLSAAHDDCPICRRPLDEATVALAHEANTHDLATLRRALAELETAEAALQQRRLRLRTAQEERRRIRHPGPQPEELAAVIDPPPATDDILAAADTALAALIDVRTAHLHATNELERAQEANQATVELVSLFREDAVLKAAIETTQGTLTELLDETVRPLASEVNQRWQTLFPQRGDLETYATGRITRTINGHVLPYDAFSTGEGTGATILLRLLIAQMATSIDFCWFDEPLEHLDPDVRRKVAYMLSSVTGHEHRLRQVVVTTYEEPLARRLHERDPEGVKLLDVRQG